MKTVKMKVNPRIIEHLGTDLITSSAVAIIELIKNSIDAHSKKVNIQLFSQYTNVQKCKNMLIRVNDEILACLNTHAQDKELLVVEDLGSGMNEEQLQEGFLNIGTDIKFKDYDNGSLGEKGIGRLATQRLGTKLIVETASKDYGKSKVVIIDWEELINSKKIDEIDLPYFEVDKCMESYTRLWIVGVKKQEIVNEPEQLELFKEIKVTLNDELRAATAFLISPFEAAKNKVEIAFYNDGIELKSGLDLELINFAESRNTFEINKIDKKLNLTLNLDITPQFIEKTHRSCIKPTSYFPKYRISKDEYIALFEKYKERYQKTLHIEITHNDLVNKIKEKRKKEFVDVANQVLLDEYLCKQIEKDLSELASITPIKGCVYNFKQDNAVGKLYTEFVKYIKKDINQKLDKYSVNDIQTFLSMYNGIKLYRNSYRIGALGNKDDDWLEMQQYRTSGQQFYRMNQSNAVGYVSINDPMQVNVREISSRLDIVQNSVSKIFKEVAIIIFNYYFYDFNRSADDITKSILKDEGLLQDDIKKEVKKRKHESNKLLEENKRLINEIKKTKEILQSKAVVIGNEVSISQDIYNTAINTLESVDLQMTETQEELGKTKEILEVAEAGLREIEIEAFNNYKLMANGLITETMTHELHSIINDSNMYTIEGDFEELKMFLYKNNVKMYNMHLLPIKDQSDLLLNKVQDIADLYNFLEKTFIKKNNYDEYTCENIENVINTISDKLSKDLNKNDIKVETVGLKAQWYMPKGVLLHVLYNLFINSIYWIDIRQKRALKEESYYIPRNKIVLEQKTESNIVVYDTGLGILKKMEYILFDALQSGKEHDGRGMGLYIVKRLLNSFKADIELLEDTNEFGNRYIFSITVPFDCTR